MTSLLVSRLWQEWHLLKHYWWKILVIFIIAMYFCAIVARNIAFMHHHPLSYYANNENDSLIRIKRLEDLGFSILPDWSNSEIAKTFNDVVSQFTSISIIGFSVLTLFLKKASARKIFTVNIIVRFVLCYVTAHVIRTFAYLCTSLPGPALHCINQNIESANKPKSVSDIFTSMSFANNCGDLLYSGHMAGYVTGFCTLVYYAEKIFGKEDNTSNRHCRPTGITSIFILFYMVGLFLQITLAIGTRQHYTVDILLAIVAGYWNFIWHLYVLRPIDMDVPDSMLSDYQKANSKQDMDTNTNNEDVEGA